MLNIIAIGALVRSLAGLVMTDNMSARLKQVIVLLLGVVFFELFYLKTGITYDNIVTGLVDGLTSGLAAIGMYHAAVSNTTYSPDTTLSTSGVASEPSATNMVAPVTN
jgi:hypothetical protein